MPEKVALDLPVLLPDALDGRDRCVSRLVESLDRRPGLDEVHVVDATETDPARLCLHYDPTVTELDEILRLAEAAGAHLTGRYQHVLWPLRTRLAAREVTAMQRGGRGAARRRRGGGDPHDRARRGRHGSGGSQALHDLAARLGLDIAELDPVAADHGDHDHGDQTHDHGARTTTTITAGTGGTTTTTAAGSSWPRRSGPGCCGWPASCSSSSTSRSTAWPPACSSPPSCSPAGSSPGEAIGPRCAPGRSRSTSLMLVAAVGAAAIGRWHDAALLLVLFGLGHALEGYAMGRAKRAIEALAELAPGHRGRSRDGERRGARRRAPAG